MSTQIWADDFLKSLAVDAIGQMSVDVNSIWVRECVPTTIGVSVITLPQYVRTVRRVTWRGKSLDAVMWDEMIMLSPATVFVGKGNSANVESVVGRPLYYCMHPTNLWDIRLFPCPNESFSISGEPNPYAPTANSPSCIVDFYRQPSSDNGTASVPKYVLRRIQKAYVLWKAFSAEGIGQNLKAAGYYQMKYQFLVDKWRAINEGCFVGQKYSLDDGMLSVDGFRYPKPILPSNFERTIY